MIMGRRVDNSVNLDDWFLNTKQALSNLGVTEREWKWLEDRGIDVSTQYIGLLRLYVSPKGQEKSGLESCYQFGNILDCLSDNVLCLEHQQTLTNTLKK